MKKVNTFQITKVQPQGVAELLLDFCQCQPGVAYKIVACKTSVYFNSTLLIFIALYRAKIFRWLVQSQTQRLDFKAPLILLLQYMAGFFFSLLHDSLD